MRFTSYKLLSALQPNSYKMTKLYIQQLKKNQLANILGNWKTQNKIGRIGKTIKMLDRSTE